jgi:hypothetical protein
MTRASHLKTWQQGAVGQNLPKCGASPAMPHIWVGSALIAVDTRVSGHIEYSKKSFFLGGGMEMDHYYRYLKDGQCEVVCTRCFETIGIGFVISEARRMAASHLCKSEAVSLASADESHLASRLSFQFFKVLALHKYQWLLLVVICFYCIPTIFEVVLLRLPGMGLANILIGDLTGCLGIFFFLRQRTLAVLLYVALSASELYLYSSRIVPTPMLVGFMDAVPTLIIGAAVVVHRVESDDERFGSHP